MMAKKTLILGAGVTGLAAGMVSGFPVYEAEDSPGGICASYYVRAGSKERLTHSPGDGEAYRFENGGGHWIFGGDPEIPALIETLTPVKRYTRKSSVYFWSRNLYVPYPLQNNLRFLPEKIKNQAVTEIRESPKSFKTMREWLHVNFGQTLCELFFDPFHRCYTAGLYETIAPQDMQKSPVDIPSVIEGAKGETRPAGYNISFVYPASGLDQLIQKMAERCHLSFGKRVRKIDTKEKEIYFEDHFVEAYDQVISTLPLNRMVEMTGLRLNAKPDPYTPVLVLNIGAVRGDHCPAVHWIYNPDAKSGFHRVGFYSNVDPSFLPVSSRESNGRVGIYVERSFEGGAKPSDEEIEIYSANVIRELQEWGFIGDTEVVDASWVDVAYTWSWPDSGWRGEAVTKLQNAGIRQLGRYGMWKFQGTADSIKDGLSIAVGKPAAGFR